GQAEPVLQPAALDLAAARGQLVPVVVDLGLVLAVDHERDGLGETVHRPAVQGREGLAVELESHRHDAALRTRAAVAVAGNGLDPRVPEDRDVEIGRLLGLAVEPQEWGYSLLDRHAGSPRR